MSTEARAMIERLFSAALAAADPAGAVVNALQTSDLRLSGRVVVVAIGKAAETMAAGAIQALGDRIDHGFVVTKYGHLKGNLDARFSCFEAAHPVPDEAGVEAVRATLAGLSALTPDDTVIALISGGGSALFEAPAEPVTLADVAAITSLLLAAGAPIQDLNAVRIPLSAVKGGRLRLSCPAARFVSLLLSDVLGNNPQVIASGPTVAGSMTGAQALAVLDKYRLRERVPAAVLQALRADKRSSQEQAFEHDIVRIVADNERALDAVRRAADAEAMPATVLWRQVEGEAAELGRRWSRGLVDVPSAGVLLGGGEATVTVRGNGSGGRNTEFVLASALELERLALNEWTVGSLATDGQDALTGAAGAIASAETIARARSLGIDPERELMDNNSAGLFAQTGGLVITGPTGTNVNDLYFAVKLGNQAGLASADRLL